MIPSGQISFVVKGEFEDTPMCNGAVEVTLASDSPSSASAAPSCNYPEAAEAELWFNITKRLEMRGSVVVWQPFTDGMPPARPCSMPERCSVEPVNEK